MSVIGRKKTLKQLWEQCSQIKNIFYKNQCNNISLKYQEILKLYQVQCSVVHSRGSSAVSTLQCTTNQQFAIQSTLMQSSELNFCALKQYVYIFLFNFAVKCTLWEINAL